MLLASVSVIDHKTLSVQDSKRLSDYQQWSYRTSQYDMCLRLLIADLLAAVVRAPTTLPRAAYEYCAPFPTHLLWRENLQDLTTCAGS